MSTNMRFLIRDGLESDLDACLSLDHTYTTEYVWQMNLRNETGLWTVTFKTEHLPHAMQAEHVANTARLRQALPDDQCFVVAVEAESGSVIGYLTMQSQPVYRIALLQDLLVSRPYRSSGIGTRLVNVARQWARSAKLSQMTAEVPTKNLPAITFFQQAGFDFCGFNDHYFPNHDIAVFFSQALR